MRGFTLTIVNTWIDKEKNKFVLKITIGMDDKIWRYEHETLEAAVKQQDSIIRASKVRRIYNVPKK